MSVFRNILVLGLLVTGIGLCLGNHEAVHHTAHRIQHHKYSRKHRAANDGALRFEPAPYNKKLELNTAGKIHCKVAGGVSPSVQWFLNDKDPLPDGVTSQNGTLMVSAAARHHTGQYSCRAQDGNNTIEAKITLAVVVSPRVLEPSPEQTVHAASGSEVWLHCRAAGDPAPTTHWDRNLTILHHTKNDVDVEGGANASTARFLLLNNGTLYIREAKEDDTDRYGCTAGSAAGLARNELLLIVHPEGEPLPPSESTGVASKAVIVSVSVCVLYMILVLTLMLYCRRRRLKSRERGEKLELEMAEGREKLVEEEEKKGNGAVHNGRLLHDKDSGPDNSEVSGVSRASKKSGQFDHLSVPRTLLTDQIPLGRGEFGDVVLAKIDLCKVKRLREKKESQDERDGEGESKMTLVLVKMLTTKEQSQFAEFRRQLDIFSRVKHANVVRLFGLCNETYPHYMLLEHTDWGDLKNFLIATRSPSETASYQARVGPAYQVPAAARALPPLAPQHQLLMTSQLAAAAACLAAKRITHRDIAARNCVITSQLHLKLSFAALTRGPDSHEYFKYHEQVIPLRWLPAEAVLEGEYSTKSDVTMFATTIWEIYTKAELPFAKLNDNSVLERLKSNTLERSLPDTVPEKLATLLKRCWHVSPTERPQFSEICEEVNTILREMTSDANTNGEEHDTVEE